MNKLLLSLMLVLSIFALSTTNALACCSFSDPASIDSVTADPGTLWPPNHKMVEIDLLVVGTYTGWYIGDVTSEEAFPCTEDCQTENDPDYFFDGQFLELRAERTGEGGARQYQVQIMAENCTNPDDPIFDCKYASGWFAIVTVPHNMSE